MNDFREPMRLREANLSPGLHAAEILENAGMRSCIVGDFMAKMLGFPLNSCEFYLAVADEQVKTARSLLIVMHGFTEVPQTQFFDEHATQESQRGWPGHRMVADSKVHPESAAEVMLVPATYWHLDLSRAKVISDTFVHTRSFCRFPRILTYFYALTNVLSKRHERPGLNRAITKYFETQYSHLLAVLPKDILRDLRPEDRFFVDLFDKVLAPSARKKVCSYRKKIRDGLISVEDAKAAIARKDIGLAAI
ncbi:hypothetical protein FQN49_000590 [Arthroderma sp. PD_2]|nr:hypothetical protein FQN49_000590 [Arthroderma sp. PD_2]